MSNETDDEFEDALEYQEKEKTEPAFDVKAKDKMPEAESLENKNEKSQFNDSDEEQTQGKEEDEELEEKILEKKRIQEESLLTEEQLNEKFDTACNLKLEGNTQFKSSNWEEAIFSYTKALEVCPLKYGSERSKFFSNRAACYMKLVSFLSSLNSNFFN